MIKPMHRQQQGQSTPTQQSSDRFPERQAEDVLVLPRIAKGDPCFVRHGRDRRVRHFQRGTRKGLEQKDALNRSLVDARLLEVFAFTNRAGT